MDDRWNTTSVAETHADVISAKCRILAIILAALIMGQLVFAAVIVFAMNGWNQPPKGMLLSLIAVGFAVQMFAMAIFVPAFVVKTGVKKANGDIDQLLGVCQVKTIIGGAFLEGGGFLNLVAFQLEHNKWSLIPVAAGIFFILTMIPTPMRLTNWLDEAKRTPTE